jgi:uncharacterized protein YaaW (UPF0174 family)
MQDSDLIFLKDCSNEQLKAMVDILVFDKDGKKRHTESLSNSQAFVENYPGNIKALIPQIVDEIQRFGGNTIMNVVRGHGVPYREILEDVCNRLKVNYNKKLATDLLETELLKKVAVTVLEKMTDEDIKKFNENLDKTRFIDAVMHNNNGAIASIIAVVVAQITKQATQKGAVLLFGRALAPRLALIAVPVVNAIVAAATMVDVASPAYRVTVPFVITAAFTRRQLQSSEDLSSIFA